MQITSSASLILYLKALIVSRLYLCLLSSHLIITPLVIAGLPVWSGRKISSKDATASLSFIPPVSCLPPGSDWKLNTAFLLRDYRDGVQVLSVAGRPVNDGVHVVGGVPPSSLASLHQQQQQDSKRQRLAEPHNLPQLRIDTREAAKVRERERLRLN